MKNRLIWWAVAGISILLLFVVLGIPAILLYSYVLTKLWAWFLVPTFGCPPITMAQGYGITLIVAMLTHQIELNKKSTEQDNPASTLIQVFILLYGRPLLTLAVGWLATLFL